LNITIEYAGEPIVTNQSSRYEKFYVFFERGARTLCAPIRETGTGL